MTTRYEQCYPKTDGEDTVPTVYDCPDCEIEMFFVAGTKALSDEPANPAHWECALCGAACGLDGPLVQ